MARPVQPLTELFRYVLPADRELPPSEQSVFVCRPLTQAERMRVLDGMEVVHVHGGERELRFRTLEQSREIVLDCLVSVENFPPGDPAAYPANGSRDAKSKFLERLDVYDVYRVGQHILDHSAPGQAEKNF